MLNKLDYQNILPKIPTILDRVHWEDPLAIQSLSTAISKHLSLTETRPVEEIVVVCIGTDRSTGDALGPIIGAELTKHHLPGLHVYGTLDHPVHAANLADWLAEIEDKHPNIPVIAIDACLGKAESVGYITAKSGPLRPGTGVNKNLPSVGDMHIIGTVNVGGFMEYLVLQNTRLSLIMNMAKIISASLSLALRTHLGFSQASVSKEN